MSARDLGLWVPQSVEDEFRPATGELWVGDIGWELWEMVHRVERGANYGWSVMEGPQPVRIDLEAGAQPITAPLLALPHTAAASITGGFVYRGRKFPELTGKYIFGDWETHRIWSLAAPQANQGPAGPLQLTILRPPRFASSTSARTMMANL